MKTGITDCKLVPLPKTVIRKDGFLKLKSGALKDKLLFKEIDHVQGRRLLEYQKKEYYSLIIDENITIEACTETGWRRGMATLNQLLFKSDRGICVYPKVRIEDWPDMEIRGVLWDAARQVERYDFLEGLLLKLNGYKINTIILYLENKYQFRKYPELVHPIHYTARQMKRMARLAETLGMQVIPAIPSLGHAEYILKHDKYKTLGEAGSRYQLCSSNPDTYKLLEGLYADWIEISDAPYIHINCDESPILGLCRQCFARVNKRGRARLLADHINRLYAILNKYRRKPMMWADMLLQYPDALDLIPKDIILFDWHYGDYRNIKKMESTIFLQDRGFEVIVSPAATCIEHLLPMYHQRLEANIRPLIRLGVQAKAKGQITNAWELFSYFPHAALPGLICSAEYSWSSDSDFKDFEQRMLGRLYGGEGYNVKYAMEHIAKESLGGLGAVELEFVKRNPMMFLKGGIGPKERNIYENARLALKIVSRMKEPTRDVELVKREIAFAAGFRLHIANRRLLINKAFAGRFAPRRAGKHLSRLLAEIQPLEKEARNLWARTRYAHDRNLRLWFLEPLEFERKVIRKLIALTAEKDVTFRDILRHQHIIQITFYPSPLRGKAWEHETMQPIVSCSDDGKNWKLFYNKHFGIWKGMESYKLHLSTIGKRPPRYIKVFFVFTAFPLGDLKSRAEVETWTLADEQDKKAYRVKLLDERASVFYLPELIRPAKGGNFFPG